MCSSDLVLYLLAALVLPDIFGDSTVNLRDHYYDHRRWFFSLLVLLIVTSIVKQLVIDHELPHADDFGFHVVFAVLGISGIVIGKPRYHEFLAALGGVLIFAYIAFLFEHLR